jgi:predicted GNAT family acetyltransferase
MTRPPSSAHCAKRAHLGIVLFVGAGRRPTIQPTFTRGQIVTAVDSPQVRNDREHHRLVIEQDGGLAFLDYADQPGRLILIHTEVPEALGGHGLGGELVRAALAWASADQLTVVPWCPFARRWLREHTDVAATVTIDWAMPRPER